VLFRSRWAFNALFIRVYTFLSQVLDYGNTAVEKRAIFFRRLLPLLDFGREREGIDLSKVVLTHHTLRSLGKRPMLLDEGETPMLAPMDETGILRSRPTVVMGDFNSGPHMNGGDGAQ
jgi:hypothetical protein